MSDARENTPPEGATWSESWGFPSSPGKRIPRPRNEQLRPTERQLVSIAHTDRRGLSARESGPLNYLETLRMGRAPTTPNANGSDERMGAISIGIRLAAVGVGGTTPASDVALVVTLRPTAI